ncbi:hypothetical protein [Sporosarcina sp. USHLN248]|uniref:hypothetical protein n=1 Tax=Sporosarcina sp. USHLN248 TaxID=3081300 RepID=UPI003019B7C8
MTITQAHYQQAEANGISRSALRQRIKRKWSIDRAVSEPIVSNAEAVKRAAAKTPFRKTNGLHFGRERFY